MRNLRIVLILIGLITLINSCEEDTTDDKNFYNQEYRFGLWVNHEMKDTLEFTTFSTVIRKGSSYNETYSYWINDKTLHLSLDGWESSHPIVEAEKNKVVIDNMYISTGFVDNSGTFYKEN